MDFLSTSLPSTIRTPVPPLPKPPTIELEVEHDGVLAGLEFRAFPSGPLEIEQIVEKHRLAPADPKLAFA